MSKLEELLTTIDRLKTHTTAMCATLENSETLTGLSPSTLEKTLSARYVQTLQDYDTVCKRLSEVYRTTFMIKELLLTVTRDGATSYQTKIPVKDRLYSCSDSLQNLKELLTSHKERLESQLRFFSSTQYALSSRRYDSL